MHPGDAVKRGELLRRLGLAAAFLALGACLGGNGTLIGASANVVVASLAAQHGKQISFLGFMKVALPVMILTIVMANVYIWIWHL